MKKPTGKMGPYRVTVGEKGKVGGSFEKVSFPTEKDDIESYIVSCFIGSAEKALGQHFFLSNPRKNELDDFDFSVTTPKGEGYLELMEVAPLELHEGGHDAAPNVYNRYEMAQSIHSKVVEKSEKYPRDLSLELFLLLYVTNYKFRLTNTTMKILAYFCHNSSLRFDVILLYTPLDEVEGDVAWIYPMEEADFEGFDPERYRGVVLSFDSESFEVKTPKKPSP